ncbi:unnamed protein product [Didymodactylos carnosus]|uniref:Cell division cycle protein 16 homolog n=1 Tax=Didymodactylos carnosus TaxID=1234261 RepID=A0A814LPZ3_9BILA|nr:unnamed protein product [Didymodactylos carnosus]CAF1068797.1 unnamed protein product [Didymodactylos carnosus]CAF3500421.1 unnamed protein product [Didymodactylos carnosus]CAF3836186.1 unnamed protein product [Didymodactylos carnosus]
MIDTLVNNDVDKDVLIRVTNKLRRVVEDYFSQCQFESAVYWGDKLLSLSRNNVDDLLLVAKCLMSKGDHHRTKILLENSPMFDTNLQFKYLVAMCNYKIKDYQAAASVLDQLGEQFDSDDKRQPQQQQQQQQTKTPMITKSTIITNEIGDSLKASIYLLRGKVAEAFGSIPQAMKFYEKALKADVFCSEAYDKLIRKHMLTPEEEQRLLERLPIEKQCDPDTASLVACLYEQQVHQYMKPIIVNLPQFSVSLLNDNPDYCTQIAEKQYYNYKFRDALDLCKKVLNHDPYHQDSLFIYISLLYEMKDKTELFSLGHRLARQCPENPISWLAVGCYYLVTKKPEPTRRYLAKATTLRRSFGPAWLALGHSYGLESEHDHAISAYFTAADVMRGCHLPILYVGLEYSLTNNLRLAERLYNESLKFYPEDPAVLHELGVINYLAREYAQALTFFERALAKVEAIDQVDLLPFWEPLFNNMGHVCRKLKKYDESISYFKKCLGLTPRNPHTLIAIGFVHALQGNYGEAIQYLHQGLWLSPASSFAQTLLNKCFMMTQSKTYVEHFPDPPSDLNEYYGKESSGVDKERPRAMVTS